VNRAIAAPALAVSARSARFGTDRDAAVDLSDVHAVSALRRARLGFRISRDKAFFLSTP